MKKAILAAFSFPVLMIGLVIHGHISETNREQEKATKAASIERDCRGENLPSYGAPEPAGYRECIAASKAIAGLN